MRIMGWDLSMSATGVALPDGSTAVVKPRGAGYGRLVNLEQWMDRAITVGRPQLVVVEDIRAGLKGDAAKVIPMVHGVALLCLSRARIPFALVNASTLKVFATGNGGADKDAMARAALERAGRAFPGDKGGDQCDAWWLKAAGHAAYGEPIVDLPASHTDALHTVAWPRIPGAREPIEHVAKKRPGRRKRLAAA
jgi:Holliday junction resolvasome RuvABC endonuclease subunit